VLTLVCFAFLSFALLLHQMATLVGHTNAVTTAAVHPSGELTATGSADDTIILWSMTTFEPLARFSSQANGVRSVHFSTDCALLVSSGRDGKAKFFHLSSKSMVSEMGGPGIINTIGLSQVCDSHCPTVHCFMPSSSNCT
jgi:WD40 repeat protein